MLKRISTLFIVIKYKTRIRTRIKSLPDRIRTLFIAIKYKTRIRTRVKSLLFRKLKNTDRIFKNKITEDIVKIETYFPQQNPHGFTNSEINYLFDTLPNMVSYRPYNMTREGCTLDKTYFGTSESNFIKDKEGYLEYYKSTIGTKNAAKIKYLDPNSLLNAKLAFTTFLDQTFVLCPFFIEMKIPFIFTLYAGGSFGLNNETSDNMLRDIFSNKFFRKVIVNNDVIRDYLIQNSFCPEERIEFVFGVPVQFKKNQIDISQKKFFCKDKDTFDICFVAFRYDDIGKSKGYDLFIEAAKKLANLPHKNNACIRFHVIGNFDKDVIDVTDINDKIFFHGVKAADWLLNFYYNMDIVVTPNRQHVFFHGSFDGYPMSPEQSLCGVAMFQSDELNMNCDYHYYKKDEIVHIKLEVDDIVSKIDFYFRNVDELYKLAENGRKKTELLFDLELRTNKIKEILLTVRD